MTRNTFLVANKKIDAIVITETQIAKDASLTSNLTMKNFSFKFTLPESSAGGTLLYTTTHVSYKPHSDLNIYKNNKLEYTFIEIINRKSQI